MSGTASSPGSGASRRLKQTLATRGVRRTMFAGAHHALRALESRVTPALLEPPSRYLDLTDVADPVEAVYRAEFKTAVIAVPLASIRWSRLGLRLDDPANPFVATVRQYLAGEVTTYEGSALERHYREFQPTTVGEAWGIAPSDDSPGLGQPAASLALPWTAAAGTLDPTERLLFVDSWNRRESASSGSEMGVEHGHKHFGPVTEEFGRLEYRRYTELADKVAAHGFEPYMGGEYVGVQILVDGDRWVAVATGPGLHRSVVAATNGVDPLVVAVDKRPTIVNRVDSPAWPGVRSGLFGADESLRLFDRFISGEAPLRRRRRQRIRQPTGGAASGVDAGHDRVGSSAFPRPRAAQCATGSHVSVGLMRIGRDFRAQRL